MTLSQSSFRREALKWHSINLVCFLATGATVVLTAQHRSNSEYTKTEHWARSDRGNVKPSKSYLLQNASSKTRRIQFQLPGKVFSAMSLQPFLSSGPTLRAMCESSSSISSSTTTLTDDNTQEETEPQRFERVLAYHRSQIEKYRSDWEYKPPSSDNISNERSSSASTSLSTTTPSRSWPDDIPSNEDLSWLLEDIKYCARSPNFRSDKGYCDRLNFRVASALLMQFDEGNQKKGFEYVAN